MDSNTITLDAGGTTLEIGLDGMVCTAASTRDGVVTLSLDWVAKPGCQAPRLTWRWPLVMPVTIWRPASDHVTVLDASWAGPVEIDPVDGAPVSSLVDLNDDNVLTYALSIAGDNIDAVFGVEEETNSCLVTLAVPERVSGLGSGSFQLRIDTRRIHFAEVLSDVDSWWREQLAQELLPVPPLASSPAYSTWYSMHQHITPAAIRAQAEEARKMGFKVIVVDDGWHTADTGRGYAYCGDWEPSPVFAGMRGHVRDIQQLGLKYVLWYALPLLGKNSRAAEALADYTLGWNEGLGAYVLDPRFPRVRQYLADIVLRGIADFGLDGVKLDFLDHFARFPERPREGTDCANVSEGVERLLQAIIAQGRELRADLLIEFRQPYIGPRLWKYSNFLRAGDCPFDAGQNRVRTVDLRLLSGDRAVHSDMLMWNPDGSPESGALQLINVLFSAPQVSVLLDKLPPDHRDMLAYWITFTQEYKDVLLHGSIRPRRSDLRYPLVDAERDGKRITAAYSDMPVDTDAGLREHVVINGTQHSGLIIRAAPARESAARESAAQESHVIIRDCRGNVIDDRRHVPIAPLTCLAVPVAGTATLTPERA